MTHTNLSISTRPGIEEAVALIKKAKRPVILAGQGTMISRADKELMELATKLKCPVTSTLLGKGVFPETHELSLGMLGMHGTAYANKAMVECDLLLNVGSRFDDRIIGQPDKFCADAKIIHIDIDPAEMDKMIAARHPNRRRREGSPHSPQPRNRRTRYRRLAQDTWRL